MSLAQKIAVDNHVQQEEVCCGDTMLLLVVSSLFMSASQANLQPQLCALAQEFLTTHKDTLVAAGIVVDNIAAEHEFGATEIKGEQ